MATRIELGDIAADVVFKDIKHVHLSVHPPAGRVRISAPKRMSFREFRAAGRKARRRNRPPADDFDSKRFVDLSITHKYPRS
jgi:hypothetical protein